MVDTQFYGYVSKLLYDAGHMITSDPVYTNHSASEALYIDSAKDVTTSRFDRTLLMQLSNISLLAELTWPGVVEDLTETVHIYSATIDISENNRSQIVADTHRLLHQYWDCHHSIVFYKNRNQYIISFANKDQSHILSDWFDINVDYDEVVERIDTANISLESSISYFSDFIYAIAREYYLYPISVEEATYSMIPLTFVASAFGVKTEASKDDVKALAKANLLYYETLYGDDYVAPVLVGYDEQAQFRRMATELDRISFELELAAELDDEDIGVELDDHDDDFSDFDDDFGEELDDDVDPAIFDDPVLMVKWLEKQQKRPSPSQEVVTSHTKPNEADPSDLERIEAERRREAEQSENARAEAKQRERERLEAEQREHDRLEEERLRNEQKRLEAIRKRQIAEQKRQDAEQKRRDATQKRSEADRLSREVEAAETQRTQKRKAAAEADQLRVEAENAYCAYRQNELMRKRIEAEAKLRRAKELRDLAMLKRKNAEQLALAITTAEMRRDEKRLVAEKCTQVSKDLEHQARQEALQREQERIAAEQRERERLAEMARREAQFDSAKQKLKVNDGDPFVVWLSNKANGEFLVDIYIAYELVQQYAYNNGLIDAPLLTITDAIVLRSIQNAIRIKRDFIKLDANTRYFCGLAMRHYSQYVSELEAARIEQERIASERREQERIAALQRRMAELEAEHEANIVIIEKQHNTERLKISSELVGVEKRLSDIEVRISSLGFLQFMEKKSLKAEQSELLGKRSQLVNQRQEVETRFRQQLAEEKRRFENAKLTLGL